MIGARIHDGDIVFIRQQSSVNNGEIAAVLIDGAPEPRRFHDQLFLGRTRSQAKRLRERVEGLRASREALVAHV